jgi:hypothetical protein
MTNKKDLPPTITGQSKAIFIEFWSGRKDLNLRPLGPEPNVHKLIFEGFCGFLVSGSDDRI